MVNTSSMTSPQLDDSQKTDSNPKKNKGGRPKIKIDYEKVARYAHIHCTQEEIASLLDIGYSTLKADKQFLDVYKKALDGGKKSLRRLQFEKAEGRPAELLRDKDGNTILDDKRRPIISRPGYAPDTTMQIWLGKQQLGQRDHVELGVDRDAFAVAVVIRDSGKGKPFKEVTKRRKDV
ncbi:hypothetical protein LCGC14_2250850 [marine sediment metagenome]|uniref:Uncharacterized protein n=1 Tax=marine sediment metagenome TaxID=412755 RepID=A0A0F9FF60_9ZZZZ